MLDLVTFTKNLPRVYYVPGSLPGTKGVGEKTSKSSYLPWRYIGWVMVVLVLVVAAGYR